jgi:transposase-like protein
MPKIYSEDFRIQAVSCVNRGKSREEVCDFFNIGLSTLCRWLRQERVFGSLLPATRGTYKTRKIDASLLKLEISSNPDATLSELAERFDCCFQTIDYWCRKLDITRKKNPAIRRARRRKA